MNKNYIKQLKEILTTTGWTQQKLAQELKVTFAALNRWLNKRAIPHPSTKEKIYALYKAKVGILPLERDILDNLTKALDKEKKKHKNIAKIIKNNQKLRDDLLLELTYNSNAIEGSTLTKKETESIIFDRANISDKSYTEHLEATNHAAALNLIFNGDFKGPIKENAIKKLHQIVLQGIRPDAGKYSKHQRAIRGVELTLPAPEDIPEEMNRYLKKVNQAKNHLIEHIAEMHADFEAIHPFGDGNGRVGRLITIIQLLNADYAPCIIEKNKRANYYEVLEFAQKKSTTHLTKFTITSIQKGYQIIRKHKK